MKNREGNSNGGSGIGFVGLLQVAFIVLKLCHVIDWSWLWVLSPTWISIILFVLVIVVVAWLTSR
jgi:hypothetical protein